MVIDQKFVGKTYPDLVYEIGKEKLKEFLVATKADQEKFAEITPPTFPVVYAHDLLWTVLFDQELKLNLAKLVHGEQDFVYHKPTKVGDTITTKSRIEKIFSKSVHDFVVMVSESFNQNKELVCTSTWTFIIRGGNDKDFTLQEKLAVKFMSLLPPCPSAKAKRMAAMEMLEKITGTKIVLDRALQDLAHHSGSEYQVFIDKYMPQVYAGASGDFNVIHLDDNFGRQVGLGGYILHGMATMALGVNYFMKDRAADSIKRYRARFSDVVQPMDTLIYSGTRDGNTMKFTAKNQSGKEVLSAGLVEFS